MATTPNNVNSRRRIRILQVVGGLTRGGIETWLMHMLRNMDRDAFQMDFVVQNVMPEDYSAEVLNLGCKIFACGSQKHALVYARNLQRILCEQDPYDIVHSHVAHYSGHVLRQASRAGVEIRLAHSHNSWQVRKPPWTMWYERTQKRWIQRYATSGLACSSLAAECLFGRRWRSDGRFRVLLYGFDFSAFDRLPDKGTAKRDLGIPPHRVVIGHIGRFHPQKNHALLLRIFRELVRLGVDVQLLLVGDGKLMQTVQREVAAHGLQNRVLFAGVRDNVAPLFAAMDLFVFPSRFEGLGAVIVEAQAAGVPAVISDAVPSEADVIPEMICRVAPNALTDAWVGQVMDWIKSPPTTSKLPSITVRNSCFALHRSVQELQRHYSKCCGTTHEKRAAA